MGPDVWGCLGTWAAHLPYFIPTTVGIGLVPGGHLWFILPAHSLTATSTHHTAKLLAAYSLFFCFVIYHTYGLTCTNNHSCHPLPLPTGMGGCAILSIITVCNQQPATIPATYSVMYQSDICVVSVLNLGNAPLRVSRKRPGCDVATNHASKGHLIGCRNGCISPLHIGHATNHATWSDLH